jgi:hypothetical protein
MSKNIIRKVLFSSEGIQLEVININVGDCKMKKFREIRIYNDELEVLEHKCLPNWYLRYLKLKTLGI